MEITRNEAQVRMFNGNMLELLVNDNEYGMALADMDSRDENKYFKKSIDERAEQLVKMIQEQTKWALKCRVEEILEHNEKGGQ